MASARLRHEHGLTLLRDAVNAANGVVRRSLAGTLNEDDAGTLANALEKLRSATNWLEGSNNFESAHQVLDHFGRVRRLLFADDCALAYAEGVYQHTCPVALAHNRVGLSIGAIIEESECSICGLDPDDEECFHVTGRYYDNQQCVVVVTKASMDHVAIVERPDFPDARLAAVPMSTAAMREVLGDKHQPGVRLTCDRCLSKCSGIVWPMRL
ncbi:hypothetical protein J2Y68_001067 [Paenarthrobacter nitroguajacolicus]|nr:hypothetical protein [Paenarthrobacter nitroguajacolicus]